MHRISCVCARALASTTGKGEAATSDTGILAGLGATLPVMIAPQQPAVELSCFVDTNFTVR